MTERRRHGLAPTPGTEKQWPPKQPEAKEQVQEDLGTQALSLAELPIYVSPPADGPSGSW
jgi:hypothetical protein